MAGSKIDVPVHVSVPEPEKEKLGFKSQGVVLSLLELGRPVLVVEVRKVTRDEFKWVDARRGNEVKTLGKITVACEGKQGDQVQGNLIFDPKTGAVPDVSMLERGRWFAIAVDGYEPGSRGGIASFRFRPEFVREVV